MKRTLWSLWSILTFLGERKTWMDSLNQFCTELLASNMAYFLNQMNKVTVGNTKGE